MAELWDAYDKNFNKMENMTQWSVSSGKRNYRKAYRWLIFTNAT